MTSKVLIIITTIASIWTATVWCDYEDQNSNYDSSYNDDNSNDVQLVSPDVVNDCVLNNLLTPSKCSKYQITASKPLPAMIVNQPDTPPIYVSSGYSPEVKAAALIYKMNPSVIYHHEVIHDQEPPLVLNPVYVKVVQEQDFQPSYDPSVRKYRAVGSGTSTSSTSDHSIRLSSYAGSSGDYPPPGY